VAERHEGTWIGVRRSSNVADEKPIRMENAMIALTDSMRHILEERRSATLATQNGDGSIHVTPVWYVFGDGTFYVESLASDRKARNVAARPGATIIVDRRQPGSERWVYASGAAEIVAGEASRSINARIARRYLTDEAMADARIGPAFAAAADVTICLRPAVWRSWSLQDLDEQYFGGLLASTPAKWFRPLAE
jgi:PPOX class probable F420-dependent enzyme